MPVQHKKQVSKEPHAGIVQHGQRQFRKLSQLADQLPSDDRR